MRLTDTVRVDAKCEVCSVLDCLHPGTGGSRHIFV